MKEKETIFYYHANCLDGIFSSWAAYLKFKEKADYKAFNYGLSNEFDKIRNKKIYFLDLSLPRKIIQKLKENNNYLVLIDHHLSSKNILDLFDETKYDPSHCGCVLTYSYFFKNKKILKIFKYIEDIDLWQLKVKNSKEVYSYLESIDDLNFKKMKNLANQLEDPKTRKKIIEKGKIIEAYKNSLLKKLGEKAFLVRFENYEVLAVNTSCLVSEIGNYLAKQKPPFSIIFYYNDNGLRVSLRGDKSVDLSKIAEKYGGGGHFSAASFLWPKNKKEPWERI
ncbi:MAG: DHHA1 domain-containing protein [Minisyncoccia bacterium]